MHTRGGDGECGFPACVGERAELGGDTIPQSLQGLQAQTHSTVPHIRARPIKTWQSREPQGLRAYGAAFDAARDHISDRIEIVWHIRAHPGVSYQPEPQTAERRV
jgi:hypothetical protein